ncbi:MAG: prepilin-type N-terminal cleavage/methylation domain-containing protein [Caldisericota bacterium]|jgi:prepilin-type N-terminal cleavage/methylation domain-containing protein|nr:prepilin-type N-terminal cleavage/methylation domain-containing protein [Caldisericota bacterium]
MNRQRGFTLLEVLIVVAVLAILAGIAIPNYLAIQQRAWLSAAKFSLEHFRSYLEIYRADFKSYPAEVTVSGSERGYPFTSTSCLYLTAEDWDKIIANLAENSLTYQCLNEGSSYLITAQAKDRNHTTLTATPGGTAP